MNVTVLIPARDEEAVIQKMVTLILAVYPNYVKHVIVVDDGSTDKTAALVTALAKDDKRIHLIKKRAPHGVGLAIREGLLHVPHESDYVFSLDADFIRNIPDLEDFFKAINNFDGLIGSRYKERYSLIHYPWLKRLLNRGFHLLVRLIFAVTTADLTNNFKLYKREVFTHLPLSASDFAVNAETGLYPILLGYHIAEIPVAWYAREQDMGISKFHLLKVTHSYIRVLLNACSLSDRPLARLLRAFVQRRE